MIARDRSFINHVGIPPFRSDAAHELDSTSEPAKPARPKTAFDQIQEQSKTARKVTIHRPTPDECKTPSKLVPGKTAFDQIQEQSKTARKVTIRRPTPDECKKPPRAEG